MKKTLISIVCTWVLFFCDIAIAEQMKVQFASHYPYKNLIERTDDINVFYTIENDNLTCKVEVKLDNMKWESVNKEISKTIFNHDPFTHCLSRESAEQILFQSLLQFGRGL